ncbi:hypothetical protein F5Y12DRAFT_741653 [Xylaria sp. FL1777]|nr:hypothetical protein F5Y12DRAFT_741653 [Xylaria sp. FL1777]
MVLAKFSQLSLLALALASPALACVQFDLSINSQTGIVNAALIDNGGQKCSITNKNVVWNPSTQSLSCVAGYSANFDRNTGVVTYQYGTFDGSFGTTVHPGSPLTYWTASVWGC